MTRSPSPPLGLLLLVSQTTREAPAEGRDGRGVHLQACARRPRGLAKALVLSELFLSLQKDVFSSQYVVETSVRVSHGGSCCFLGLWNPGGPLVGSDDKVVLGPWCPQAELPGSVVLSSRGILSLGVSEDSPSRSRRLACFTKPPLRSPFLCDSACCPRWA